eukprot:13693713-Ditylum_brightwellii.AAC.1
MSYGDAAACAALDLIEAINNPQAATPFPHIGHKQMAALRELANIFHSAVEPTIKKQPLTPVILAVPRGRPLQAPPTMPNMAHIPPPRVNQTF